MVEHRRSRFAAAPVTLARTAVALLAVFVALAFIAGCSSDSDGSAPTTNASAAASTDTGTSGVSGSIIVSAAASLTDAFTTIRDQFVAANPDAHVTLNFGSSGALSTQILNGAPADVAAFADTAPMNALADADLLAAPPKVFARNRLVIVTEPGNPNGIDGLVIRGNAFLRGDGMTTQTIFGKFSLYIRTLLGAPDILVTQEVENLNVLERLAARLNADDPSLSYSAYLEEGNDVGGIDVGFLTKNDTIAVDAVTQVGKNVLLSVDGSLLNDRPPLVLDARYVAGGANFPITVIGVHQRSLSGIDDPGSNGLRVKTKRFEQSEFLAGVIQDLQTTDPSIRLVVTGDFNALQFTDGYVDVLGMVTGNPDPAGAELPAPDLVEPDLVNQVLNVPADDRYSFVFDGGAQVLDPQVALGEEQRAVLATHARGVHGEVRLRAPPQDEALLRDQLEAADAASSAQRDPNRLRHDSGGPAYGAYGPTR